MPTVTDPKPLSSTVAAPGRESNLVHPAARGPLALLVAWTLPLLALNAINGRALWLAWSEMGPGERDWGLTWVAVCLVNLAASGWAAAWLHRTGKRMEAPLALGLLSAQAAHLVFASFTLESWLPSRLQEWIVSVDQLLMQQWTYLMAPAFLAGLVVSGFKGGGPRSERLGSILSVGIGVPLALYALAVFIASVNLGPEALAAGVAVTFMALGALGLGVGILRAALLAWRRVVAAGGVGSVLVTVTISLILPYIGLAVNAAIPFPVSFQHPAVYVLVALNGVALLLPRSKSRAANQSLWMLRCLTLPFTLYFFFVYLPFLPLSLPACIVMGAGILLFAPALLLALHGQKLWRSYQAGDCRPATYWVNGALAAALLPGYIVAEANFMRHELHRGIDYALTPDLSQPQEYKGFPRLVGSSLEWLQEFKYGTPYPLLTPLRGRILFNGLILPNRKAQELYDVFEGKELPAVQESFAFLDRERRSSPSLRRVRPLLPLPKARLHEFATEALAHPEDASLPLTRLHLWMQGGAARESEFKASLQLPEGAWVSGFALYVGDERVEGRLFEEKAALWVYRTIRDENRHVPLPDPATLTLERDGSLRLQVFPFRTEEIRKVEIDFVSLRGGEAALRSEEQEATFALSAALAPGAMPTRIDTDSGVGLSVVASEKWLGSGLSREPYLHVLADRSRDGLEFEEIARGLKSLQQVYPQIRYMQLTAVNLEARDLWPEPVGWDVGLESLEGMGEKRWLPRRRGLLIDPALQRAASGAARSESASERYPVLVVLTRPTQQLQLAEDSRVLVKELHPDAPEPRVHPLRPTAGEKDSAVTELDAPPVALLRAGEVTRLVPLDGVEKWIPFGGAPLNSAIEIFDGAKGGWRELEMAAQAGASPWLQGLAAADLEARQANANPAYEERNRRELVAQSKELNALLPQTAFIVVENDAQWKALEEKERQKLAAHGALELDDTPEPWFWALAAGLLGLMLWEGRLEGFARPRSLRSPRPREPAT